MQGEQMTGSYTAEIVDVPGHGVRLRPTGPAATPAEPGGANLLALAIALAMGADGYEHHPEPRDPGIQTIDGLLAGDTAMPWQPAGGQQPGHHIVCERSGSGSWKCHVQRQPPGNVTQP
jgi:hypothetical protein